MSRDMQSVIGGLVGGVAGFVLGVAGWLAFFYLVFMLPQGTPLRNMDQGAILIIYTGPIGAIIGAIIGACVFRRRLRPVAITIILGFVGVLWLLMKAFL